MARISAAVVCLLGLLACSALAQAQAADALKVQNIIINFSSSKVELADMPSRLGPHLRGSSGGA
jgi:hypothetical protein